MLVRNRLATGWILKSNVYGQARFANSSDNRFDVVNPVDKKLMTNSCQELVSEDTKSTVKRGVCKDFMATGVAVVPNCLWGWINNKGLSFG